MLRHKSVLIVEAQALIALDIQRVLEDCNAGETVFARAPEELAPFETQLNMLALAIIEVVGQDGPWHALACQIARAGVPVIFVTAEMRLRAGVPGFPDSPVLIKPFLESDLLEAVRNAIGGPA